MHRCLHVSEILYFIFECFHGSQAGRKTLASLARTCHPFSSPALDVLWHDLDSFRPLLKNFPIATYSVDNPQWLTLRKYAKRVKAFRGRVAAQESVSSLQRCPESYLPLLPNLIELEWNWQDLLSAPNNSGIPLLRYFAGPTVTKVALSFRPRPEFSPARLEALADLPKLCPNVTSFTILPSFLWDREPPQEVGTMVAQWPRLRTLRIYAIAQPVMDQLLSRQTLETLHIDYYDSSPIYSGTIPDTVRELTLRGGSRSLCTRFLETMYASPTRLRIIIAMDDTTGEPDSEMFHLLPCRINTSRLLSLTILPTMIIQGIPMWRTLGLREPLVSVLVEFGALRELDLDSLRTAPMSDNDYECLAGSLTQLRRLKLGTANSSIAWSRPVASVGAVIAILRCCEYLETLHILFDGSIPPPQGSAAQDSKLGNSEELVCLRLGVSNRRITKLHVGYSPIGDATVTTIACCLKSIMPCLVQISCTDQYKQWELVQKVLGSY